MSKDRSMMHIYAKRGTELPHAKFKESDIRKIRGEYVRFSHTHGAPALARKYGVHQRTIEKILTHASWVHVR